MHMFHVFQRQMPLATVTSWLLKIDTRRVKMAKNALVSTTLFWYKMSCYKVLCYDKGELQKTWSISLIYECWKICVCKKLVIRCTAMHVARIKAQIFSTLHKEHDLSYHEDYRRWHCSVGVRCLWELYFLLTLLSQMEQGLLKLRRSTLMWRWQGALLKTILFIYRNPFL